MIVRPTVRAWATEFNLDPQLVQAVVTAEGNILNAVRCSYPNVVDENAAVRILCRSIVHAMCDYIRLHSPNDFIAFFGARWAPVGAANDPHGLNANWVPNVQRLWGVDGPTQKL